MKGKRKKLTASAVISIVLAALCVLAALSLIITNIFVPVKYLAAYVFCGSDKLESADVTFVDVGYGTSIIVRFPDGKTMLIGGGDETYTTRAEIIKQLNKMDIDRIDWLVCPSVNGEHCGGLAEIIKYKEVGTVYYPYCLNTYVTDEYRAFTVAAQNSGADMVISEYGAGAYGDDYFFSFLSPTAHTSPTGEYADLNDYQSTETQNAASAVLWVEISGTSFLFCCDATEDVMTKVAYNYFYFDSCGDAYAPQGDYSVNLQNLDIAEAACHGGSASATFYDYASPDYTVVSVGENTSGYPTNDALSVICEGSEALTTKECGTIKITVRGDGYEISKEKL